MGTGMKTFLMIPALVFFCAGTEIERQNKTLSDCSVNELSRKLGSGELTCYFPLNTPKISTAQSAASVESHTFCVHDNKEQNASTGLWCSAAGEWTIEDFQEIRSATHHIQKRLAGVIIAKIIVHTVVIISDLLCILFKCQQEAPTIRCPDVSVFYCRKGERSVIIEKNIPYKGGELTESKRFCGNCAVGIHHYKYTVTDSRGRSATCSWAFEVKATFCEKVANIQDGSAICSHKSNESPVYGDTCTFSCNSGFELDASSVAVQECKGNGEWSDGGKVKCSGVSCGEIQPPNHGSLSHCTNGYIYRSRCTFMCNEGFAFPEIHPVKTVECQSDRSWSGTPSDCRDVEPPEILNCPTNIIAYNDWRKASAKVTWTPPNAFDNLDGIIIPDQTAGGLPGSVFISKQVHTIQYDAIDEAGNEADPCVFTVYVDETTCPIPPSSRRLERTCEEHFSYGAHCNFSCEGSFQMIGPDFVFCDRDDTDPNRGFLNWGANETAAYCLVVDCADLDPPVNGALSCGDWANGRHCQMMCNVKYDIPRGAPASGEYVCDLTTGIWHPHALVPNCSALRRPGSINLPNELFYFSGDCTSDETLAEIREQYIKHLNNSAYKSLCQGNEECRTDNVQVTCGPISEARGLTKRAGHTHRITIEWDIVMSVIELDEGSSPEDYWDYYETKLYSLAAKIKEEIDDGKFNLNIPGMDIQVDENSFLSGWADIQCGEGEEARTTFTCAPCPTGTFYNQESDDCEDCPVGFYSDIEGAMNCLPCPEDTSTLNNRSTNITQCLDKCTPGTYSESGLAPCAACPSGTYQSDFEGKGCPLCPPATISPPESTSGSQCHPYQLNVPPYNKADLGPVQLPFSNLVTAKSWLHIDAAPGTSNQTTILELISEEISISLLQQDAATFVVFKKPGLEKTQSVEHQINDNNWHHLAISWYSTECRLSLSVDDDVYTDTSFADFCGVIHHTDIRLAVGHSSNTAQFHLSMLSVQDAALDVNVSSRNCTEDDRDALWSWDKLRAMPPDSGCTISYPSTCGDDDNCQPDPCNGHPCLDQIKDFICFCERNFTGKQCEIFPDYCAQALCQNEASCVNNEDGYICECGPNYRGKFCHEKIVHGGWTEWSEWSECSLTCGEGFQSRSRTCSQPPPDPDGRDCDGHDTENKECNGDECPKCPTFEIRPRHIKQCDEIINENGYTKACNISCSPGYIMNVGEIFETSCGTFSNYTWTHQLNDPNRLPPPCFRPMVPSSVETVQTFDIDVACDEISNEESAHSVIDETMRKRTENSSCFQSGRCTQNIKTGGCVQEKSNGILKRSVTSRLAVYNVITADLSDVSESLSRDDIDNDTAITMLDNWLYAVTDLINISSTLNESIQDESLFFHIDGVDYYVNKASLSNTGEMKCGDGMSEDNGFCMFCDFGTFESLGNCTPCPVGTYQDILGQTSCKECPTGTTTEDEGATNITLCSLINQENDEKNGNTHFAVAIAVPLAVVGSLLVLGAIYFCHHCSKAKWAHKTVEPFDDESQTVWADKFEPTGTNVAPLCKQPPVEYGLKTRDSKADIPTPDIH